MAAYLCEMQKDLTRRDLRRHWPRLCALHTFAFLWEITVHSAKLSPSKEIRV